MISVLGLSFFTRCMKMYTYYYSRHVLYEVLQIEWYFRVSHPRIIPLVLLVDDVEPSHVG